jgi:hypothetical protein
MIKNNLRNKKMNQIRELQDLAVMFSTHHNYDITKAEYLGSRDRMVKVGITTHAVSRFKQRLNKIIKVKNLNYRKFMIFLFNNSEKMKVIDLNDRNPYNRHGCGGTVYLQYYPFQFVVEDTVLRTVKLLGKYKRLM